MSDWHNFEIWTDKSLRMPSAVIKSFSYNEVTHRLSVILQSGLIYDYLEVPKTVYEEMKQAFSKGTFYNERVKPFYRYEKISD